MRSKTCDPIAADAAVLTLGGKPSDESETARSSGLRLVIVVRGPSMQGGADLGLF
jgi:hypothetical protein